MLQIKNRKVIGVLLEQGDKLTNRHFNKCTISVVEKDENMPMLPDGRRVDVILT